MSDPSIADVAVEAARATAAGAAEQYPPTVSGMNTCPNCAGSMLSINMNRPMAQCVSCYDVWQQTDVSSPSLNVGKHFDGPMGSAFPLPFGPYAAPATWERVLLGAVYIATTDAALAAALQTLLVGGWDIRTTHAADCLTLTLSRVAGLRQRIEELLDKKTSVQGA